MRLPSGLGLVVCSLLTGPLPAKPLVVALGIEADDADSRSYAVSADIGITEKTWLSGAFALTDTERAVLDVSNRFGEVMLDHHFEPVGVRVGIGYWGDDDLLESTDLRGALYLRGERGSISFDYQRRDFDLTIGSQILDEPRTASFDADGVGLSASLSFAKRWRGYLSGMDYDYSRNLRIQPNVDRLRLFSLSRLSLFNGLVDFRASAGLELRFGDRSLDFRYARWRTEVDQGEIDSIGVGFLTPVSRAADIELRLAYDDSENFGGATVLSFFLYLYKE